MDPYFDLRMKAVLDVCRASAVDCVLDVGAHDGTWARRLRAAGWEGRMVLFEPQPELLESLRQVPNVKVHGIALGSRRGYEVLRVGSNTEMASFLRLNDFGRKHYANGSGERNEIAGIRRLDDLSWGWDSGDRFFLKVDTQGYDLKVVRGAAGLMRQICGIQVEMAVQQVYQEEPNYLRVFRALDGFGFLPSAVFPVCSNGVGLVEFDCVFVRKDLAVTP